ncbi:peptidylprolyl isomerase [Rhodopila sp.]|uniref:peptidylprolyl isomerase n=1 Tax=Rhodopila sp. TaxID=2480087 RepID=UPI003D139CE0
MPIFPDCSSRAPAHLLAAILILGSAVGGSALAQTPTAPAGAAAGSPPTAPSASPSASTASPAASDPVLATVNGAPIHMSDLNATAETLPPQARSLPPQQLYPMLLEQLIDARALLVEARKTGLDKDPEVQRSMQMAQDRALESAFLSKAVRPQVTDEAVKARYEQDTAAKAGEPEVHARHILVGDEATAKKIIADLKNGGDFVALSKQYSKDPGASAQGGDLGFFKKTDMVPDFATAAFALKDGEVSPTPVHTQFGWHVIQVLGHRDAPKPSFDEERAQLRQSMVQAAVQKEVAQARGDVKVETFKMDGSPAKATDTAEPPAAK